MTASSLKTSSIIDAFSLASRELIALVGGGGKSGLMQALAREMRSSGLKAVASTTTKVRPAEAEAIGDVVFCDHDSVLLERLPAGLAGLFIGGRGVEGGKIGGVEPGTVDSLFSNCRLDYLIVEADGAAGRPLKSPASHEPVIPSLTTLVVAVMGLEALGNPVCGKSVFRMDRLEAVTGLKEGEIITPESVVRLFSSPSGLFKDCPAGARKVVLLNKADLMADSAAAVRLADMVLCECPGEVDRVVVGSLAWMKFEVFVHM